MTTPAALITGGAIRLGRALALQLARLGHDVALHYHSSHTAALATQQEIRALGVACHLYPHDLRDFAGYGDLVARVVADLPHLGVLVNSASTYTHASLCDTTPELFDEMFGVNLKAPFFLTQAFARTVSGGVIINICDNKIHFNQPQYAAYLLAKKGLAEFTRMAAIDLAPAFRVNAIAPGVTLPAESRSADYIAWRVAAIPLKRKGESDHIAQALTFLLHNDFMNGAIITVDGGESQTHIGLNAAMPATATI
jgi:pteridine reductase